MTTASELSDASVMEHTGTGKLSEEVKTVYGRASFALSKAR